MSEFRVDIRKISEKYPHPNADKLEICKVYGLSFQFITIKGQYKVGDIVVYFPVDSILPDALIDYLDLKGRLAGKKQNRIKTIKLRNEISQGIVVSLKQIEKIIGRIKKHHKKNITEILNITKYEPEIKFSDAGILLPLPHGQSMYDIESCDRNPEIVEYLIKEKIPVEITEKLEGTNISITCNHENNILVNQRKNTIEEIPEKTNIYWHTVREQNIISKIRNLKYLLKAENIVLFGELVGPKINRNIYKYTKLCIFFYDLQVNYKWLSPKKFANFITNNTVPVIYQGILSEWLGHKTIQEASNGQSILANTKREGIVIKPLIAQSYKDFGRLILKQRSPEYLARSNN